MDSTSVSSTTMGILLNEATERPFQTSLLTISLTILGYISFRGLFRNGSNADEETLSKRKYPLPPGPPRDFLIGILRHFPSSRIWEKFTEWQKLYGDVVHVALPGISLVILSSYELSQELLSKRTNVTGGRAAGYMVTDIMGLSWSLAFMQPGPHHSNQRKMLRKAIGPARVSSHDPRIEQMTNDLMLKFFNFQGYIPTAVTNAVSKLIIDLTYGEAVREEMGDELTNSNQEIMHLAEYALFNAWIVDFLHFLRFIPSWFPGANFKRIGDRSIKLSDYIRFAPFKVIQELHKSGKLGHSIATDLLGEFGPNEDTQDALAVLNTAGSDTVWTMNSLLDRPNQFHIIDHCGNLRLSARYVPLSRYCRQGL
ncbi:hypothetical protein FRC19_011601 [Serendipita sp. 401]|nr:hypothetical protein FRC19_011601 [Serendipita sp. 401]